MIIGIYNNCKGTCLELKHILTDIKHKSNKIYDILVFTSITELKKYTSVIDLLFFDFDTIQTDLNKFSKMLRISNPNCKIVAYGNSNTINKKFVPLQPLHFVSNPFHTDEILHTINAVTESEFGKHTLAVYHNRIPYELLQRDIRFIRYYNGACELYTDKKIFRKKISLTELLKHLDKKLFFQIHRNCIVNMHWILHYSNNTVTINDQELNVSRRNKKAFETTYMDYELKYR